MTPEQRLSVFAAQTADDFIANRDAVGLLFDMLATQNEKIDRLVVSHGNTQELLANHMKGEDQLIQEFKNAFPGGDPVGHRMYHEELINQAKVKKEFWLKMTFELAKWGLIGFLGWVILQLWYGALQGPK